VLRADLAVAFFNRAAGNVLGLRPSDVGRSPRAISALAAAPGLEPRCAHVVSSGLTIQHDFRAADRSFVVRITPYVKDDGGTNGAALTFTNVTAFRASLDQAIYEREYTKAILNAVADPIVVLNADLHIQSANRAFYATFRVSREAAQGLALRALGGGICDLPHLQAQLRETLADDRRFEPFEIDCDLPVIGRRTVMLNACRFSLAKSPSSLVLLSFQDVTERKRSEEQARMLGLEIDHRAKNLLAVVHASVQLTQAGTADELKKAISGRIQALSNAHTLLAESRWTGADLRRLVTEELSPFGPEGSRADVDGPDLRLEPQSAQSIAMVLHELTTNAVKYGALSVAAGRVRIEWSRTGGGMLVLRWSETGGPPVKPPTRRGFGSRVVDQIIRTQLHGDARFDWRPDGLWCEIEFPAVGVA
jgi:two-component system CheB/CheR fusion protein